MSLCLRCGKKFKRSNNMKQHFKKERLCKLKLLDVSYEEMMINYDDLLGIVKSLNIGNIDVAGCSRKCSRNVADFGRNVADFGQNVADFGQNVAGKLSKNSKNSPILEKSEPILEKSEPILEKSEPILEKKDKKNKKIVNICKYKCKKCHKKFKHHSSYYRHCNYRCKKKEKTTIINNIHNGDNIQNIQNIQNNIIINNYGEENTDYITDDLLLTFLNVPYNAIQKTNEEIHFNKDHPENKNIKSINKKEKYVEVFIKNKWHTIGKKQLCDKMIHTVMFMLDDVYGREGFDKLSKFNRNKFERFQIDMKHNKDVQKFVRDGLETLLLNEEVITL